MIRPPVRVERWIKATWFRGLREPAGLRVGLELGHFVGDVDRWPYQGEKHALPLVSFATFAGERRALAHVEHVTALAFDVDEPLSTRAEIEARLAASMDLAWSFHTSYSSTADALRFRVLAPLSRPMRSDEHRATWPLLAAALARGGVRVDAVCKDPSRAFFVPVRPPSNIFEAGSLEGHELDVDAWLEVARAVREADHAERDAEAARRSPNRSMTGPALSPFERARRYVARLPHAIAGSRGHDATFRAALVAAVGFKLDDAAALEVLRNWNRGCKPAWTEAELARKVAQARANGRVPEGFLLDARRAS